MKTKLISLFIILFHIFTSPAFSQLKPGFDIDEYIELLKIMKLQFNPQHPSKDFPQPQYSKIIYSSPEGPLKNQWNLWLRNDNVAIVTIRGTVPKLSSWMENFYTAMSPATGTIIFKDSATFAYKLAADSNASIHTGWLIGLSSIANDVCKRLTHLHDSLGVKDVIITGHSQGGAISYLMTSYLYYKIKARELPHFRLKTYSSAAPKPGNVYYAYDYEAITNGGWAFNVVNSLDWVPQTPLAVETINDLNPINPFVIANKSISSFKFPKNIVLKHIFNKMKKSSEQTRDYYSYYLGKKAYKIISSYIPNLTQPTYSHTMDYQRAGTTIIFRPDKEYLSKYPYKVKDIENHIFMHHLLRPYLFLARKHKEIHSQPAAIH